MAQERRPQFADALVTRGIYLIWRGRLEEGGGVLRHALSLADEHGATSVALRARMNLTQLSLESDQLARAVEQAHEVLAIARERGDRALERKAHGILVWPLAVLGRWDESVSVGGPLIAEAGYVDAVFAASSMVWIGLMRPSESTSARRTFRTAPAARSPGAATAFVTGPSSMLRQTPFGSLPVRVRRRLDVAIG